MKHLKCLAQCLAPNQSLLLCVIIILSIIIVVIWWGEGSWGPGMRAHSHCSLGEWETLGNSLLCLGVSFCFFVFLFFI